MSDLSQEGLSSYLAGTQDTATLLSDGDTGNQMESENVNGLLRLAIGLEQTLGHAPSLVGATASLVARLARIVSPTGGFVKGTAFPTNPPPQDGDPFYRIDLNKLYIYDTGSDSWITPQAEVSNHSVLVNLNADDHLQYVLTTGLRDITGNQKLKKATPTLRLRGTEGSGAEFGLQESAGVLSIVKNTGSEATPAWTLAQPRLWPVSGPSGTGSGSTYAFEGAVTVASNTSLSGVHFYTDFVLNAGVTVTVPAGGGALVIVASGSITLHGAMTGAAAGQLGGRGGRSPFGPSVQPVSPTATDGDRGSDGTGQPGGGGGGGADYGGGRGGGGLQPGGAGGNPMVIGTAGPAVTGAALLLACGPYHFRGGAGGGGGAGSVTGDNNAGPGGNGGAGGADIVLIAPSVILAVTSALTTSGGAGVASPGTASHAGGGGGGGAGNVWVLTSTYTNNGATFTHAGGAAGSGQGTGVAGGAGAAGTKQILLFNNPLEFR